MSEYTCYGKVIRIKQLVGNMKCKLGFHSEGEPHFKDPQERRWLQVHCMRCGQMTRDLFMLSSDEIEAEMEISADFLDEITASS